MQRLCQKLFFFPNLESLWRHIPPSCLTCDPVCFWPHSMWLFVLPSSQYAHEKNDTVIQFRSPVVNGSMNQPFKTYIHLDNWKKELKNFDYHPDPTFDEMPTKVITEASIIIVTVSTRWSFNTSCLLHTQWFVFEGQRPHSTAFNLWLNTRWNEALTTPFESSGTEVWRVLFGLVFFQKALGFKMFCWIREVRWVFTIEQGHTNVMSLFHKQKYL